MAVLIVDDSETMRMIVLKTLRQAGYEDLETEQASSAREALQKIANGSIDVVLSDMNMPEYNGAELVSVIRKKFPVLPIIMLTTESSPMMITKMKEAGANNIIHKPFTAEKLKQVISPFLNDKK